jgi:hypothetical protein
MNGQRESAARAEYAAGNLQWDAVLAARAEDEEAARVDAERAEQAHVEAVARAVEAQKVTRAERAAREQADRERREAAPRKRIAEIRAEFEKPLVDPKDHAALVQAAVVRDAIVARAEAEYQRRRALCQELDHLEAEIGDGSTIGASPFNRTEPPSVGTVVYFEKLAGLAVKAPCWGEFRRSCPDVDVATLRGVVDAMASVGGPDIRPKVPGMMNRRALSTVRTEVASAKQRADGALHRLRAAQNLRDFEAMKKAEEQLLHDNTKVDEALAAEGELVATLEAKNIDVHGDAGE